MKRRPWWIRVLMIIGIIIAIPTVCIAVVVAAVARSIEVDRAGRLPDFHEPIDGERVLDTNYVIEFRDRPEPGAFLVNSVTGQSKLVLNNDPSYWPFEYTTFQHEDQMYMIIRTHTGGSQGLFWQSVYNITTDEPILLNDPRVWESVGRSCPYPRLVGDRLEFEIRKCNDGFGTFLPTSASSYTYLELK